ncbi:effector binding domain-containing protein [Paenibacillus tarimensis]
MEVVRKQVQKSEENYKPEKVPSAFKLIHGMKMVNDYPKGEGQMEVTIVTKPAIKALVLKTLMSKRDVRAAWKEVQQFVQDKNIDWVNRDLGYVFVPEWQWASRVEDLWVGVEVKSFQPEARDEFELMTIPERQYARIRVYGDKEQMDRTYNYLGDWFDGSKYERDYSHESFSFEANRLHPINPFEIPADEINFFDFEIFAPIK